MIWFISISAIVCAFIWFIIRPDPPKIKNKYSQPGKWYWLKKVFFYIILRLRKRKQPKWNVNRNDVVNGGIHYGYGLNGKDSENMESVQPVDYDEFAIDTAYFAAFGSNGTNVVMKVARRPERCGEIWLYLDLPGIGQFQHPVHPDVHIANTDISSFNISGLQFEVLEPMRRWRVSYSGLLRVGLHNDISDKPENFVSVQMSLIWDAFSDPYNFDTDMSDSLICDGIAKEPWTKQFYEKLKSKRQSQYAQWGELRGRIKVEGFEEQTVCLKSVRDHTYGVRDWRLFHRYAIHFIWLESGLVAQVGVICQEDIFTHLKIGYVSFANGDMVPVTDLDLKLWHIIEDGDPPKHYSFTFWADNMKFDIEVNGGITPVWYHHADRGCRILERFCTYKVNGISGRGVTEYCYRNFDGPSYKQDVSLPHLCEPLLSDLHKQDLTCHTLYFTDIACCNPQIVGGKGSQLALLTKIQKQVNGIVPKGFCITLSAFDEQIQKSPDILKMINKVCVEAKSVLYCDVRSNCEQLVNMLSTVDIEQCIQTDIITGLSTLYNIKTVCVAVRSSAAGEDGLEASYAGQMKTFLGIRGTQQILDAVRQCWASAYSYQAVEYRRQHGQPIKTGVGVVIQEMVKSDVSGVLFTADPVNGDSGAMSINANYGLGESVVSGKSVPDNITIRREWKDKLIIKDKFIGEKKSVILIDESGGIREENRQQEGTSSICCLNDEMIMKLAEVALKLEKYFGNGRDIEWAIKEDVIYLLQCRPITTSYQESDEDLIHEFDSALSSDIECLTTGNIGEMMPQAVTPLTYSTFNRAVDYALQNLNYLIGARRSMCSVNVGMKACCSHLFLSLFSIESTVLSVGTSKREITELSLLGEVLSLITVEQLLNYVGKEEGYFRKTINFIKMIMVISNSYNQTRAWEKRLLTYNIGTDCEDSVSLYQDITIKLPNYYQVWECTLINSARSSSWFTIMMAVLTKGSNDWTVEHYGDVAMLLSECGHVYSAEIPSSMHTLAKVIADTGRREEFIQLTDKECLELINNVKNKKIQSSLSQFLSRHGHRCIREAEFHEKSWQSCPEKLMGPIKAILQSKSYERQETTISTSLTDCINKLKTELPAFSKWILKMIIPRARKGVGDREWGKSISIEMSEILKLAFWKLAALLQNEGRIPDADLMFYLTHSEIGTLINTRSSKLIMRAIRRRKIHPKQMMLKFVKTVSGHPQLIKDDSDNEEIHENDTWQGMPVSHGTTDGIARVVTKLEDAGNIQAGDILIVICTDIGWSPYFPLINGLVTEMGGLISHGAVVAREYGIPCVVNVSKATTQIKSGDQLHIDGKAGTISRLSSV